MGMSPFRRGVNSETKKPQYKKSGKKAWYDKWRVPQNTPTPFVMIQGEFVDLSPQAEQIEIDPMTGKAKEVKNAYYKVTKHKRKIIKNGKDFYAETICSAGHDSHNPQPCAGCMAMDAGDKTVTRSDQFIFTVVHLHPYHTHPLLDKEGKAVTKKDNSGYVMIDTECSGRTCNFCKAIEGKPIKDPEWPGYNPKDLGTTFGKRRYIEVGKGHLSNLAGWDNTVRGQCGNCKSVLALVGYSCATCSSLNIDADNDPRTDVELEEAVARPYPCMTCKSATMHKEVVSCEVCEQQGKLSTQHNLFGVVLWGSRQGEGTKSQLMLARFETPEEFNSKVPAALLSGRTVQQIVAEIGKPHEFSEIMAPEDLQDQAQKLELNGLSLPSATQGHYGAPTTPFAGPQFTSYPGKENKGPSFVAPTLPNFGK